ncbi:MAG: terminase [Dysgonamonadaceae bacterium]|jgi:DNA-binding XRE family transcriptional regulator|nr:terminase [Dysgonamonadaceae bacterium]
MATKKELEAKKELARMYYMQGETQKAIASKIEVSEQSVGKWAEKEGWAAKRAGVNITRPELVNKSLMALNKILDQVHESNDIELIAALPDKLAKFASAIEKLDRKANIVSAIDVFMSFSKWIQRLSAADGEITADFIKNLNRYQDAYINEHIKI